ncbi:hypothetical protein [Fulvivirga sp.]|uniref:hypothetical protein n=1 Tax=Fulvivirga sp. TaxID=1931237 RepID=UPI0032ED0B78
MRVTILMLFLFLAGLAEAQDVRELDKRNGFKDIKVNTSVLDYEGLEFKKETDDKLFPEAKIYVPVKGYYESIGSLKIYDLEVKTYRDSIFQIIVVTDKDPNLYKGLKTAFGEPEYHYRSGFYHWTAENLRLSYTPYQKDKIEMKYESFLMRNKLKKDKEEVVEAIVDDF